jgi:hypothetical protein
MPRLGISSPWFNAGLKFCANRRASHVLHLIWGAIYAICGAIQFVAGIYFMLELPIFHLGSNIWTGAWNCFSGVTIILIGCAGSLSTLKAQGFLLLSLVVTIVNLVNLVILEVGEWRGFLSSEDREYIKEQELDGLMYSAYLCTTIGTVIAMIASFLASQHAFCFLQLQAEKEAAVNKSRTSNGNLVHHHNFEEEDADSLMPKDLIKRHDDELNLKTPSGPQPHPSWVYRHNYAPFHSVARTVASSANSVGVMPTNVKRSMSFLKNTSSSTPTLLMAKSVVHPSSSAGAATAATTNNVATTASTTGIRTISESISQREAKGRHAVIRRHQSMYIHPRATELLPPFGGGTNSTTANNELPTAFKLHEVSGQSEVRPIVTLKRSKTTVGQFAASPHYRSSTLQPPRTFRSNSVAKNHHQQQQQQFDHNHNIYGTNKRKSPHHGHHGHYSHHAFDDICEFQAGPSFDLPDREKMRRYGWSQGNIMANGNCVLFETEHNVNRGTTASYMRHAQEDLSTDSCGENIRYQAVEGLVQSSRPKVGPNSHLLRSVSVNLHRDTSGLTHSRNLEKNTQPFFQIGAFLLEHGEPLVRTIQ